MSRVGVNIKFPAELHRERDTWVASCPQLHVASQGSTPREALAMLQEAMALFIEGCCEEGIMDRVLEESGLEVRATANAVDHAAPQDTVSVPVNMVPHAQAVAG